MQMIVIQYVNDAQLFRVAEMYGSDHGQQRLQKLRYCAQIWGSSDIIAKCPCCWHADGNAPGRSPRSQPASVP